MTLSPRKECHIFQHPSSAPLTTPGFLWGSSCLTLPWHFLPASAFHISLSSRDFPVGTSENPECPAQSREERRTGELIDPIMARLQAAVSVIPQPFLHPLEKGSPCWFINLGTKCLSQAWWVNRPSLPSSLAQLHMASRASQRLLSTFPISQTLGRHTVAKVTLSVTPSLWPCFSRP